MLKEGLKFINNKTVKEMDSARKYASGTVDVFATPAMVAFMEKTAHDCVKEQLEPGTTTVGIHVDIKHLKATPMNMQVKCEAHLVKIDGKKLVFNMTAWDDVEKIGEGSHTRFIIDTDAFIKNLELKINQIT